MGMEVMGMGDYEYSGPAYGHPWTKPEHIRWLGICHCGKANCAPCLFTDEQREQFERQHPEGAKFIEWRELTPKP